MSSKIIGAWASVNMALCCDCFEVCVLAEPIGRPSEIRESANANANRREKGICRSIIEPLLGTIPQAVLLF